MKTGKTTEQIIYVAFRLWMKMIQSEFDFVMIESTRYILLSRILHP